MSVADDEMLRPGETKVVTRRDATFYSLLHVINVVFESLLLFFCSTEHSSKLEDQYCHDSFTVGTGAVVSIVALVSGEAETSMVALQSLCCYHGLVFFAHVRRYLHDGFASSGSKVSVISIVNLVLLLQSLYFVVAVNQLIQWDFVLGVFAGMFSMVSPVGWLRTITKALPCLLLSRRVYLNARHENKFDRHIAFGLFVSALADFAIDCSFVAGLVLFLCAHFCYIAAFLSQSKEHMWMTKAMPIFTYMLSIFCIALLPALHDSVMLFPVLLYVVVIAVMVWRASVMPGKSGLHFTFGAIAFALSDTILALNQFTGPLPNSRYPTLALYFLGQALIAHGTAVVSEEEPKDKAE